MDGASLVTAAEGIGRSYPPGKEDLHEFTRLAPLWDRHGGDACGRQFLGGSPAHAAAQHRGAVAQGRDDARVVVVPVSVSRCLVFVPTASVGGMGVLPDLLADDLAVLHGENNEAVALAEVRQNVPAVRRRNRDLHSPPLSS